MYHAFVGAYRAKDLEGSNVADIFSKLARNARQIAGERDNDIYGIEDTTLECAGDRDPEDPYLESEDEQQEAADTAEVDSWDESEEDEY